MSTPYHYTPRGPPVVPHSTPFAATISGFSKPKNLRAPIINPYEQFPQDEFDAWIGGITSALKSALGQQEEEQPSVVQEGNPLEDDGAGTTGGVLPHYQTLGEVSDNDEVPDDSFADLKARRAKGKARDPREGPGLGQLRGDRAQPIAIDLSDEEEDEIAEGLTMVQDEDSSEDEEGEQDSEEVEESGEEEEEEDDEWDRGQSSSQAIAGLSNRIGPPRGRPRKEGREYDDMDQDEEIIEEYYEEEYEEGYEDDEEERDQPVRLPATKGPDPTEVIDILDSDEEEAAAAQQHAASSPPQGAYDDHYEQDEEVEGEEGYDEEDSESYDEEQEDKENQAYLQVPHRPPRRSLLADYRARRAREDSFDSNAEETGEEDEEFEEGEAEGDQFMDEEDEEGDEAQPLEEDTSFPPPKSGSNTRRHPEIRDPWEGARTYAEDLYTGGDVLPHGSRLDPDHLGPMDDGEDKDFVEEEYDDEAAYDQRQPEQEGNMVTHHRYEDGFIVEQDEAESLERDAGLISQPAIRISSPRLDAGVELPDRWAGLRNYAEDFYAGGDAEVVHRQAEPQIDPSLLGIGGMYEGEDPLEDTASGIGSFLTPGVLTPNENDIRSGAEDEEPLIPDVGQEEQRWDGQWGQTRAYIPQMAETHWSPSSFAPPPVQKRGEIPKDAEIIALDDSDEDEGQDVGDVQRGGDHDHDQRVEEGRDESRDGDSGMAVDRGEGQQPAQGVDFDDIYEEDNLEVVPPPNDEISHEADADDIAEDSIWTPPVQVAEIDASSEEDRALAPGVQTDALDPTIQIQPLVSPEVVHEESLPEAQADQDDHAHETEPVLVPAATAQDVSSETNSIQEDNLEKTLGNSVPEIAPSQVNSLENEVVDGYEKEVDVIHEDSAGIEASGDGNEFDTPNSDFPDESLQPGTAKTVSDHLSQLHTFSELPTPPWEKDRSAPPRPEERPQEAEYSPSLKATVEEASDDEGDTDSVPPGPDAVDLDIEMEQTQTDGSASAYTVLEDDQGEGEDADVDADGEAEDNVEILSAFSPSDGESGGDMDIGDEISYEVEEPAEDYPTEDLMDRGFSIDVESIYSERSVTPVGLREAVKGMGEPSKPELILPPQGPPSTHLSALETASEASAMSPVADHASPARPEVPMPVTADANVPDPTDSPQTPARPPRTFILNLTGTPKFILSPANSPRPVGEPIPVSVSMPPSILKALKESGTNSAPNHSLYPLPPAIATQKLDGLFTPAGASTSTATPVEMEEEDSRKEALHRIADAISDELVPDGNAKEWPGFDMIVTAPLEEETTQDEVLPDAPMAKSGEDHVEQVLKVEQTTSLEEGGGEPPTEVDTQPSSLPHQMPFVSMHLPLARKPTDPILMADPYPYSLSTPDAAPPESEEDASEEDVLGDISLSSASTVEKERKRTDEKADKPSNSFDAGTMGHQNDFLIDGDIFAAFLDDAVPEAQTPEVSNVEGEYPEFQEIMAAEDPFKLMGNDSTVAPGEVKLSDEPPSGILTPQETTSEEPRTESAMVSVAEPTRNLSPESQNPDISKDSQPETTSTKRGSKRKRDESPGKAESSSTRVKGKRGRQKGKGKQREPSPERPEAESILVRPRAVVKGQPTRKRNSMEKSINTQGSSATRNLSKLKKPASRASSVASSAPSDKSSIVQSSPTTSKLFGFATQSDRPHVHFQGMLFHAHGSKNPYRQPLTITKQMEVLRPSAPRKASINQVADQQPILPQQAPTTPPPVPAPPSKPASSEDSAPVATTDDHVEASAPIPVGGEAFSASTSKADATSTSMEHSQAAAHSPETSSTTQPDTAPPKQSENTIADSPSLPLPSSSRLAHISHPSSSARSTRSNCQFHKISLPREEDEEDGPRVYFILPGCSLIDQGTMQEERIQDHGQATSEEGNSSYVHVEDLDLDDRVFGIIRHLAGPELLRENAVGYLPRPGDGPPRFREPSPRKGRAHAIHSSPAFSGSAHSASVRPPVSNADSTSTSLSALRRYIDASEQGSTVSATGSELSDDDYATTSKKMKPSPPENHDQPAGQEATTSQPHRRPRGRPRKIKPQDMAYKPENDQLEEDSPEEGPSKKPKRAAKRGVKRTRTTEAVPGEGDERQTKKLRSHKTAPGSLSPSKNQARSSQPDPDT